MVADSIDVAEKFILDVERKTHAPGDAVLVFSNGRWSRSHRLFDATLCASFDDLILADQMKDSIRSDFSRFLESEDRYRRLGIAWRRGALLIGPPGIDKTHCVPALVKELAVSSLYVQRLSHHYYTAEQMWQQVFDRARGLRPCVLVFEDLDSLVTDENRSFFLNQLDGFEQNHGLIVLATTNHPDRIDPAIIERPSRHHRKADARDVRSWSQLALPPSVYSRHHSISLSTSVEKNKFGERIAEEANTIWHEIPATLGCVNSAHRRILDCKLDDPQSSTRVGYSPNRLAFDSLQTRHPRKISSF